MPATILTAAITFAATNLDDIFILTLLLANAKTPRQYQYTSAGYAAGVLLLTLISALAANGLQMLPSSLLRLLGLIPITLGVRAWLNKDADAHAPLHPGFLAAMLTTLGNGADNAGVYIPLFTRISPITASAVFLTMAALWSLIAARAASLPPVRNAVSRHGRWFVPAVFILLGLYILLL